MIPEDAQEFVSRCIWSTRTGFPFGECGLRDAQGGGKISLIEAETAAEAEDESGQTHLREGSSTEKMLFLTDIISYTYQES